MFWFFLLIIFVVGGLLIEVLIKGDEEWEGIGIFIACFGSIVFGLLCLIGSISNYSKDYDLRTKNAILPVKEKQKEDLVTLVEDQLSSEQFAALMSATETEAIEIVFNNTNAVSNILIARATEIIELNKSIYNLKNDILNLQIEICNGQDNIFMPRLLFIQGDCTYDFSPQP